MLRTFVAVELTKPIRDRAARLIGLLGAGGGNMKWVEKENLHLTLNFLGDVHDRQLGDVCNAVAESAAERQPFEIQFHGAGAFPHVARPRTVWIGVESGSDAVCQLQKEIEQALAELGFPPEGRRYHPHLTLGRQRRGRGSEENLGELLKQQADFEAGVMNVEQVVVFSSQLQRGGPVYEILSRATLG